MKFVGDESVAEGGVIGVDVAGGVDQVRIVPITLRAYRLPKRACIHPESGYRGADVAAVSSGRRLVRLLTKSLGPNVEWTESEQATLGLIQDSADRIATLKEHLDHELAKPEFTRRGIELAAEVRQLEANLVKMVALLNPEMSGGRSKSRAHQRAANARWHGAG